MNDLVSDMLARIKNGQASYLTTVDVAYSNMCESVLKVLQEEGYIEGFKTAQAPVGSKLVVNLKYTKRGEGGISELRRISKPGRRVYTKIKDLGYYKSGLGAYILSTPKGVMSDKAARSLNVGGEVICKIF
jgi:small subunit ribosomal protein S8